MTPIAALIAFVLIVLLAVWFIGGAMHRTGRYGEPIDAPDTDSTFIEPQDLKDIPTTIDVTVELRAKGFDVREWHLENVRALQITDHDGTTFYMPKDSTFKQCIDRYREKLDKFYEA